MKIIQITIDSQLNNKTIKHLLFNHLLMSDKLVTDLKKDDYIKVNGNPCTVRNLLKMNDVVSIEIPETENSHIIPKSGNLDILFEDEDIIAINKPASMPTHPTKYHIDDTLANIVCAYLGDAFVFRAVNRLDKDTTGVVLIAKNRYSADILNRQIRNRTIKKEYVAICNGEITCEGTIEESIIKESPKGIKRIISPDGQYAKTIYNPVKSEKGYTLVKLYPQTGRTHQLRVHMSHIGHPLYGDYIYGTETDGARTMLHCEELSFTHPTTKKQVCIKAPLPADFFIKY
ncbi:MAG: RluA family pseudouridine synthase [Clostridia bacterium]|nr:RluA family pseudouridine synthase [Clostridia bacterium]